MTHWLLAQLEKPLTEVFRQEDTDEQLVRRCAEVLEIAVLDLVHDDIMDDEEKQKELKCAAADAFRLFRTLPLPVEPLDRGVFLLRAGCLAILGDKGADAARWMEGETWPELPLNSEDWGKRTWATVIDVWLRLVRKKGWDDRDKILEQISSLRAAQSDGEKEYFKKQKDFRSARATALELIALYHLAKAAEIFVDYRPESVVERKYHPHGLLGAHFDQVMKICEQVQMFDLEPLSRLLAACTAQMKNNSILHSGELY